MEKRKTNWRSGYEDTSVTWTSWEGKSQSNSENRGRERGTVLSLELIQQTFGCLLQLNENIQKEVIDEEVFNVYKAKNLSIPYLARYSYTVSASA